MGKKTTQNSTRKWI